ncbi:methyl-accepting chemotaxis protein [Desulforegula conservatrix]|uniref:methyl-accepting chemotaxis protein n=1 Tax=Desulforegula conservatrix TaxID=153026 RepID=UPI0004212CB3|nr:methyl-accepting chemotaxis protein [Desulforegula conservatrix]
MFKKSISHIFIVPVLVALTISIAGLVWYISNSSYNISLKLAVQSMNNMADTTEKALDLYISGFEDLSYTISMAKRVRDSLSGGSPDVAQQMLEDYVKTLDDFNSMVVFDMKGIAIAGVNNQGKSLAGMDLNDRDYVQNIIKGKDKFISESLMKSKVDDSVFFAVAHAVKNTEGKTIGGTAVIPKWEIFTNKYIDPIRFGERGYPYMIDGKGVGIAHAIDKSIIFKDVSGFDFIKQTLEKKNGHIEYEWKGEDKIQAFATNSKTGWVICMSAYSKELAATALKQRNVLIVVGITVIAGLFFIMVFFSNRLITMPVVKIMKFTERVAKGDLAAHLEGPFSCELEELAKSLAEMQTNMKAMISEIKEGVSTVTESSETLKNISNTMETSSKNAAEKASRVSHSSEIIASDMTQASANMEISTSNVNTIATATEEMTSTINEIARNAENGRSITGKAVDMVRKASEDVEKLTAAANEIGKVTETINDISDQTNLLALNATIEAARAGEAGKGFAVVANEIKELARQTAEATQDIKTKITDIQETSNNTTTVIRKISEVITDVNSIVATTAASVEEQNVATKEIAKNITTVSENIGEVASSVIGTNRTIANIATDMKDVDKEAAIISDNSSQISQKALNLASLAKNLESMVQKFSL